MVVNLYNAQLKAMYELANGKILCGGVGSGKSITSLAYYFFQECGGGMPLNGKGTVHKMTKPMDLYVITTAKKRDSLDWENEALRFHIPVDRVNSYDNVQIKVDSWNNIDKYTEVDNAFFIFDEQRLVGSGAWVKSFLKIAKRNRWILLSGTPGDVWFDYAPVFIANGYYKNKTDFERNHVVYTRFGGFPKVDRYVETSKLERLRRGLLVEMPVPRHTKRHIKNIVVPHDKEKLGEVVAKRWNPYTDEPIQNVSGLVSVMRRVINEDVSRIGEIMKLLEKHPRLIVFYNFDYELSGLRVLANTLSYPVAEWNGHKHEDVPESEKWMYLVQYTAGSEAWNCITTDAMAFYSLNYSYRVMEQCMGRIDRLNTPFHDLKYYVLRSMASLDNAIVKAVQTKKVFNEKAFVTGKV